MSNVSRRLTDLEQHAAALSRHDAEVFDWNRLDLAQLRRVAEISERFEAVGGDATKLSDDELIDYERLANVAMTR